MKVALVLVVMLSFAITVCADEYEYRSSDQSILVMPTAYTIPTRTFTYTNYQILIQHLTYSPRDRLHLGLMFPFPISKEFVDYLTPGFKYTYYLSDKINMAVGGSYTLYEDAHTLNHILSVGKPDKSWHLLIGYIGAEDTKGTLVYAAGFRRALKPNTSFLAELITTQRILNKNPDALFLIGLRFHGSKVAWDLGGARLIAETDTDLWLLPFIKATVILR